MLKPGDRVAYSVQWLDSISCRTGDLPAARGTVTNVEKFGSRQLVTVDWGHPDLPVKVLACNLAKVGANTRFAKC